MFRLNFLVVMVMAVTNHEFVRYYVCAMHTYWFITVYAMMAVFKRYNDVSLMISVYSIVIVSHGLKACDEACDEVPGSRTRRAQSGEDVLGISWSPGHACFAPPT